jgi:hypothetical protein
VPPVGPPQLAPPPSQVQPQQQVQKPPPQLQHTNSFSGAISNRMSDLSLTNSKDSRNSLRGKKDKVDEGEKKKSLFGKMKW